MSTRHRKPSAFTIEQVTAALSTRGIPFKVEGKQVNADVDGGGHHHIKITPQRGLFLDATTGKGGTVSQLLRRIGANVPVSATGAAHPAAGGNLDDDQEKKIERAQSIWGSGWACSSAAEVYTGPLLDTCKNDRQKGALRSRMHAARDAAFAYFTSRKLDHRWMPQLRIYLLDPQKEKDDYAMKRQGAIGAIAFPMYNNGVLVGIQRVFLDAAGRKISRMMLGKKGIMNLAPLDSAPIIKLPSGDRSIVLWGEGWETCAHAVQSSHLPCVVLYTSGQIRKRADLYLEQSATATPDQIANMPVFGLLVDRDASNTGQNTCIYANQRLRKAGLDGLYLCPPDVVRGGGKDADWADAGEELGERGCGVALSVAMHQQPIVPDCEEKDDLGRDETPWLDVYGGDDTDTIEEPLLENFGISIRRPRVQNWRKSTQPSDTRHTNVYDADAGREILKTGIEQLVDEYIDWLDKYREAKSKADDGTKPERVELPPFRPFLFRPTTGVGKSTHLKALPNNEKIATAGGAVRIFVATKSECSSFVKANSAFFWYHGRNPDPSSPGYCANYKEMMKAVDTGHMPQAEFCFNCKHGLKWSIKHHGVKSERGRKSIAILEIMGFTGDDLYALEPCVWQDHQRKALQHQQVVTTHYSYSENLTVWQSNDGPIPALSCFDEDVPFAMTVEKITQERIDEWSRRNAMKIQYLQWCIENNVGDRMRDNRALLRIAKSAQDMLTAFAMEIARLTGKDGRIAEKSPVWQCIANLINHANNSETAGWERLAFDRDGSLYSTPLRGAYAIAQTLRINDGFIKNGGLYVSGIRPIVERIGCLPTAFFNATPSPVDESIIRAKEGVIIDVVVRQHAHITRRTNRFWGLKWLKIGGTDSKRTRREVTRYEKLVGYFLNRKFIFHKSTHDHIDTENTTDKLGHWGADHRAHNRFAGDDLVIAGSFFIPQQSIRHVYQSHRLAALTGGASPGEWPQMQDYTPIIDKKTGKEVDDAFEGNCWIDEGNGVQVKCMVPLPRQPQIRTWFLKLATIETVQAIGRARAVNPVERGKINIDIFGGVPLLGLAEYGLAVDEYLDDPKEIGMTQAEYAAEQHEMVMTDLTAAAIEAVADGQAIARDALSERVRANRAEAAKAVDNAHDLDEAGVCGGSVLDTITYPPQTPPAATGVDQHVYKQWLESVGMPIFAAAMAVNGRAAAAVRAAQQAITNQVQADADKLFTALEEWAESADRDGLTLDEAAVNDENIEIYRDVARFYRFAVMKDDSESATILNPWHPDHAHFAEWRRDQLNRRRAGKEG